MFFAERDLEVRIQGDLAWEFLQNQIKGGGGGRCGCPNFVFLLEAQAHKREFCALR